MAKKTSQLPALTAFQATDLLNVSHDNGGGTYQSQKATMAQLLNYFNYLIPFLGTNLPGAYTVTTLDLGAVTYSNGTNGVGAYLLGAPGALNIQGNLPPINSYVLVNAQTLPAQNGLYQVTNPGGPGIQWRLTRPAFYDNSDNGKIRFGNLIFVQIADGATNESAIYYLSSSNGSIPIVGTTALNYTKVFQFNTNYFDFNSGQLRIKNGVSLNIANTGLSVQDADGSNILTIIPGSNLTANRTLTVTTGDSNRTLNISAADVTISSLGALITALSSLTQYGVLYGNGTSAPAVTAAPSIGQLLVGQAPGNPPTFSNSIDGNITFTSSGPGQTRTVRNENTSNTIGAGAIYELWVAGGVAADPFVRMVINGGQTWSMGAKNNDSDAFVLSANTTLGTNNVMRVAATGEINYPLQPAFSAFVSTPIPSATGDGTVANITGAVFTEIFDQNADFSNGTLTAPVTGRYQLNMAVICDSVGAGHTFCELQLVTSNRTWRLNQNSPASYRTSVNSVGYNASALVDMDVGDTANMAIQISNSTKTVNIYGTGTPYTCFSGYLVA